MARPFSPAAAVAANRYLIVPCEADGCGDLAVIWDRIEEQVIDVVSAAASARWSDEDLMWEEFHAPAERTDFAMAA